MNKFYRLIKDRIMDNFVDLMMKIKTVFWASVLRMIIKELS
ncbi:hypothetical protein DDB_G0275193 [Dictyostelium discoideum AX4]|uniref:Uncharacterized protein n=1 Tax=Dictyostelium discoideum TaxID=44689 RepID=Q553Y3_DICDI|nr:hypothetical protein DDB_G0275193 [Dictyostelium discoideum AX4]EAL69877.1 hypothetical protein DDB_G0275193 [Dictyostelium discoideum AX4]|eukprot:XP_643828.1 hypothetical protein DDB_G0275193 [Dictyostelium discoideum AX4]